MCLNGARALIAYVSRYQAGERASQVDRQCMGILITIYLKSGHVLMGYFESALKFRIYCQMPVEEKGVLVPSAKFTHLFDAAFHHRRHIAWFAEFYLVSLLRFLAEHSRNEVIYPLKITGAFWWACENQWHRNFPIFWMHQDSEQVENLFHRADTTGEHDYRVRDSNKCFEALFHVRHDHELVDDRIGRFSGNNAGLGHPDISAVGDTLFGVTNCSTLHRPLHRARPTTGANIELAQTKLVADLFAVLVLRPAD